MPLVREIEENEELKDESEDEIIDLNHAILKAFKFLQQEGPGDVLVFLPGGTRYYGNKRVFAKI